MINELGYNISQSLETVAEGVIAFDAACTLTHGGLNISEVTSAQAAQVTEFQATNAGALELAARVAKGIAAATPTIEAGKNDFLHATTHTTNPDVVRSKQRLDDLASRVGSSSDTTTQTPLEASTALVAHLEEIGSLAAQLNKKLTAARGLAQFIVEKNRPPLGPSVIGDVIPITSDMKQYRRETGVPIVIPPFFDNRT